MTLISLKKKNCRERQNARLACQDPVVLVRFLVGPMFRSFFFRSTFWRVKNRVRFGRKTKGNTSNPFLGIVFDEVAQKKKKNRKFVFSRRFKVFSIFKNYRFVDTAVSQAAVTTIIWLIVTTSM